MLVVAGNLTLDDTVMPDGRTIMGSVGGDVLYTALGAAIWNAPVGLLGRIGDDLPPGALDGIEAAGLDCRGLILVPGPNIHYWVLYEWDGRRRFIFRSPVERLDALSPEPEDLPLEYLPNLQAFHVAAIPFDKAERLIRHAATLPRRPAISLDTHEDYVDGYQDRFAALLPLLTAFLPSREEVALWFGDDDPERRIGDLLALGPRIVAIKMGADGALVQARGDPVPQHIPAFASDVVDVTGAGDAFCGGFVARMLMGDSPRQSALAGAVSASFAVERYGSLGLTGVDRSMAQHRLAALSQQPSRSNL